MANNADPDQLASSEATWTGSTLFAKAGRIRVKQDQGKVKGCNVAHRTVRLQSALACGQSAIRLFFPRCVSGLSLFRKHL